LQKIRGQNIIGSRDREEVSREAHRQSVTRRSNAARKNPQNCWKPVRVAFATAWSVKDERDRLKKRQIRQSAAKLRQNTGEGSETIMGTPSFTQKEGDGIVHSL